MPWRITCGSIGAAAPGHRRARLAREQGEQGAAGAQPGLVHVDVRVGLVAGDHGGVAGAAVVQVGVHVERDADRHVGGDGADAPQQLAFAVVVRLRVTIAPCRSSRTPSQPAATASQMRPAMCSKAASSTGPLGQAAGGDRDHDLGAGGIGELDEGGDRRAGAG